jgi:hypothetical protein
MSEDLAASVFRVKSGNLKETSWDRAHTNTKNSYGDVHMHESLVM